MPMAVCSVDFGFRRALRISDATRLTRPSRVMTSGPTGEEAHQIGRGEGGEDGGQRKARCAAEQDVVDHRQRRMPFAQEAQAGVDHAGADIERERQHPADAPITTVRSMAMLPGSVASTGLKSSRCAMP